MTLFHMSIYGAVIILAILLVRAFTLYKLPKKTFLILWAVALVRLLVPCEISSSLSLYSLLPENLIVEEQIDVHAPNSENPQKDFEDYYNHISKAEDNIVSVNQNSGAVYLPIEQPKGEIVPLPDADVTGEYTGKTSFSVLWNSLSLYLPTIWAIGVCVCALFFLTGYLRCLREFCTALPVTEDYAKEWLKQHSVNRTITIRQSDKISAPLTYGMLRPVILMPKKTDWNNHAQLDYVLYHEFTHIRRFDLLAKLVTIAAVCLHWFNPFVWLMYFFFNRDLELSCDDCVVKHFKEAKADYANTLIGMEEKKSFSAPLCNHFSKSAVEERITAIMKSKKTTIGMMVAAIIIVILVVVTLTTGRKNADKSPESSGSSVMTDSPTPTTPPNERRDDLPPAAENQVQSDLNVANGLDIQIMTDLFSEYRTMWIELFNSNLECGYYSNPAPEAVTINGISGYYKVLDERFPTMQSLIDYMETIYTPELAAELRKTYYLSADTAYPLLAELNGVLYTQPYHSSTNGFSKEFQFTNVQRNAEDTVTVTYQTGGTIFPNIVETGTITFRVMEKSSWRIADLDYDYKNIATEGLFEDTPASLPSFMGPDWYSAVDELMHGNTPENTVGLPYDTPVPDYTVSSMKAQATSYLAQCGLGTRFHADYYAVCETNGYTVYAADISYAKDSPSYFTIYHAYDDIGLVGKVIFRHRIAFYDTENLSHAWANYINMDDVVTMAKEEFAKFCNNKGYSPSCEITSIHMTSLETIKVEFSMPTSDNFDIYTEATVEFTYDFSAKEWNVSRYEEICNN